MKLIANLRHRRRFVSALIVAVGIGIGITPWVSQALSTPAPKTASSPVKSAPPGIPAPVAAPKVQSGQVGWIVVYATPFGFEPTEVTVPAGTRVMNVQTCTGTLVAPTYRLTRPNASPLDLPQEGNDAKVELTLSTGTYQLSDPANADVGSCTITVTP